MKGKKEDPADFVFERGFLPCNAYLFDDGTFGAIYDPDFDLLEFMEIEDFDTLWFIEKYLSGSLEPALMEDTERYIRSQFGEKLPIGNLYIDRWGLDGEFYQGGCFIYFLGETLRDYCERNGEPIPVRQIPFEVIDAFEAGDAEELRWWSRKVPELKNVAF